MTHSFCRFWALHKSSLAKRIIVPWRTYSRISPRQVSFWWEQNCFFLMLNVFVLKMQRVHVFFCVQDVIFRLNNPGKENSRVQRYALVGGSRNMYSKYTNEPMGPLRMKIRQLQAMDYHVIPIPWYEFLPQSPSGRKDYLAKKFIQLK